MDSEPQKEADARGLPGGHPELSLSAEAASLAADRYIGRILDNKYQMLELIGEGAMGKVYRARHIEIENEVAVKILQPGLISSSTDRLKRELVLCAGLKHPSIVRVYAAGISEQGDPFLIMDLIRGSGLDTLTKSGLSLPKFFAIFKDVVSGLKHAHAAGIVHRDLKPGNILVTQEGGEYHAVIVDFGIAKAVQETAQQNQQLTRTGTIIGTTCYMSPEQCMTRDVDARSDIYSLGCVMYEGLTGQPPFDGDSAFDVMYRHLNQSLSELGALTGLPKSLSELIMKCLAKNPQERFQSMLELEQALEACANSNEQHRENKRAMPTVPVVMILSILFACLLAGGFMLAHRKEAIVLDEDKKLLPAERMKPPKNIDQFLAFMDKYTPKMGPGNAALLTKKWLDEHQNDNLVDQNRVCDVHHAYGVYAQQCGDNVTAISEYEKAAKLCGPKDSRYGNFKLAKASVLTACHFDDEAIKEFKVVLADLELHPDLGREISCWLALTGLYINAGDLKAAQDAIEKTEQVIRRKGVSDSSYLVKSLLLKARLASRKDQPAVAAALLKEAERLSFDQRADRQVQAQNFMDVAETCRLLDEVPLAIACYRRAAQLAPDRAVADQATRFACENLYLHDREAAEIELQDLVAKEMTGKQIDQASKTLCLLSNLSANDGRRQESAAYARRILPFFDSLTDPLDQFQAIDVNLRACRQTGGDCRKFLDQLKSHVKHPLPAGRILQQEGECDAAVGNGQKALALYQQALDNYVEQRHFDLNLLERISDVQSNLGRQEDALATRRRAVELARPHCSPDNDTVVRAYMSLAHTYGLLGKAAEARQVMPEALKYAEKASPALCAETLRLYSSMIKDDDKLALSLVAQASKIADRIDNRQLRWKEKLICRICEAQIISHRDPKEAMTMLVALHDEALKKFDIDPWCTVHVEKTLYDVARNTGDKRSAVKWMISCVQRIHALQGETDATIAYTRMIANTYEELSDDANTEKFLQQALAMSRRHPNAAWQRLESLLQLGRFLAWHQRCKDAQACLTEALEISNGLGDKRLRAPATHYLAIAYQNDNQLEKAVPLYLSAAKIYSTYQIRALADEAACLNGAIQAAKQTGLKGAEAEAAKLLAALPSGAK